MSVGNLENDVSEEKFDEAIDRKKEKNSEAQILIAIDSVNTLNIIENDFV